MEECLYIYSVASTTKGVMAKFIARRYPNETLDIVLLEMAKKLAILLLARSVLSQ